MKSIVFSLLCLCALAIPAAGQGVVVTEASLSPSGGLLAFIVDDGQKSEIALYDFAADKVSRLTDSAETEPSLALKSSVNWIDDGRIVFLSKHTGIFQQYVLDIAGMEMAANGSSTTSEYDLAYSRDLGETFYLKLDNAYDTGIYRRPMNSSRAVRINDSAAGVYSSLRLSPGGAYITVQKDPDRNTLLFSTATGQEVKTRLQSENAIIWAWSPDGNSCIYSHAQFDHANNATEFIYVYDVEKKRSSEISYDTRRYMQGAAWSPCGTKYLYVKSVTGFLMDAERNKKLSEFTLEGRPVAWLPDCRNVVFVNGGEIFVYDTEAKTQKQIY